MKVVRVQFKKTGKKYFFDPAFVSYIDGDSVVVETVRGVEMGYIVGSEVEVDKNELATELKPVIRKATEIDIENYKKNKEQEESIVKSTKKHVRNNDLEMKILGCEYTLDRSKLIIYFEAEGRIDFRKLVKDLADEFHVRIELRQIGSRDGAKFVGGLGPCGLKMCCVTHLCEFDNVSIKMAKNQNLSLNPQKISGTCGKLLCCIKYENEDYKEIRKTLPDMNEFITANSKKGKVIGLDILNKRVKVRYQDGVVEHLDASDVFREVKKDEPLLKENE